MGNFSSIVPAPATGLAWSFNPTNGKLTAVTGVSPSASTNAYLTSVVLTPAGALSPSFATNGFSYTATNAFTDRPTVTVTNADSTATNTLFLNGVSQGAITSGVPSMALTLNVGSNNVAVQVVSQDLSVTNLYTVNVLLQPSLAAFKVTNSVVGSTNLVLTWPVDHTGYNLLTQTNNLNKGVSKNTNDWGTLGYTTTNAAVIPITKTNLNSYYRLVYP